MLSAYSYRRKIRVADKKRFYFSLMVAALLFIGISLIVAGICRNAGQAASRAATPPAKSSPSAAASAPPKAAVAQGGSNATARSDADAKPEQGGDWRLTLVNAEHPLPEGFTVQTRALPNGLQFDARAFDDLTNMIRDGQAGGLDFVICSAYRTVSKQQELFDQQVSVEESNGYGHERAVEEAKTKVALPGTSEHNLGLAADIVALRYQKLDKGYLDTPECKWLQENSWKYGFIMRYPEGKSGMTGIIFEPWHYRYVGAEAAKEIKEKGLCLEEYLGMGN